MTMKKLLLIIASTLFSLAINAQTFQLVKNVNTSPDNAQLNVNCSFREMGGKLYYVYIDQATTKQTLFVSDGTSAGTNAISPSNVNVEGHIIVGGNKIYFFATDGINGKEPWVSDGTPAGTMMLKNINASTSDFDSQTYSSNFLSADSTKAFFKANDGTTGNELWVTDGTALGTVFVADVTPGSSGGQPSNSNINITTALGTNIKNGKLFFIATGGAWVSDGTAVGTHTLIANGTGGASQFISFNGAMYFFGNSGSGNGLWKTDGTIIGTQLIYNTTFYTINEFAIYNNFLYFTHNNADVLYKSDGTTLGTNSVTPLPGNMTNVASCQMTVANNTLFLRSNTSALGTELYKLDNTTNTIVLVKDIAAGSLNAMQPNVYEDKKIFQVYDNKVWFFAFTNTTFPGYLSQMYSSDGTSAGTIVHSPLNNDGGWAGGLGNNYSMFAASFGLFMIYNNPTTGDELYMYTTTAGVNEKSSNSNAFSIYPNPTNSVINVECLMFNKDVKTITITDVLGKIHLSKTITDNNTQLNVSDLTKGIYFVTLTSSNKTSTQKVIIN